MSPASRSHLFSAFLHDDFAALQHSIFDIHHSIFKFEKRIRFCPATIWNASNFFAGSRRTIPFSISSTSPTTTARTSARRTACCAAPTAVSIVFVLVIHERNERRLRNGFARQKILPLPTALNFFRWQNLCLIHRWNCASTHLAGQPVEEVDNADNKNNHC
jgi:hypothetical protein